MDAKRFDLLARTVSTAGSRRAMSLLLGVLPLAGWLASWLGAVESAAKRRKRRGRKLGNDRKRASTDNHKHEGRRRKHRNKRNHRRKHNHNEKKTCKPEPRTQTCDGTCGTVKNRCKKPVDCGSCACDPPCLACQRCNLESVTCETDPEAVGESCGNGQLCQDTGECACSGTSCGECGACGVDGTCQGCDVCCNGQCCGDPAVCHAETDACCEPESDAETCDGACGPVENNCGIPVGCEPCECTPECGACETCNGDTGACEPNPDVIGESCGQGQLCQEDGSCACSGNSCGACGVCGQEGECGGCEVCCDGLCCGDGNVCHTQTESCCEPDPDTCEGQCGPVVDNCGQTVGCGACECASPCGVCQQCNVDTGECENDPDQAGESCGDGLICQANGQCVCSGNSCGNCRICDGSECVPDPTIICSPLDQCHDAGVCDPQTGQCTNPPKANNTPCNDGNACTQTDTCQAGACTGGNPVVCTPLDECHVAGVCNSQTGICSNPLADNGTTCGDNGACADGICAEFCSCGEPICFLRTWGTLGSGNEQFELPGDIAVTPDGTVYVADMTLNRITFFDAMGVYQGQWGVPGGGPGQFFNPTGIATSPDGSVIYVVDTNNNRVQSFAPDGTSPDAWGDEVLFSIPNRVAVSPDGNTVFVTDIFGNPLVHTFAPDGTSPGGWGTAGTGVGEVSTPEGIALSPDGLTVYLADGDTGRVQRFTPGGVLQGVLGAGPNQLQYAMGVAVAPNGVVYVTDLDASVVQYFAADGAFLGFFGGQGSGNGQFLNPRGVAVAPDGTVFVADSNGHRVQAFCVAPG